MTNRAPSRANKIALARPMPLAAPVTIATLPSSRPMNAPLCCLTLSAILPRLPQHVARALVVGIARGHEQKVGQPIDVFQHLGRDALVRLVLELGDQPLGTPAHGAGEMQIS